MSTRHAEYARAGGDFYSEPQFAVDALFDHIELVGALHDPCCGLGTIPDVAMRRDIPATGADIADRANGRFDVRDFLTDTAVYPNIVCNPPYQNRQAPRFVQHALGHVQPGGSVAMLVPISFLASQQRYTLFVRPDTELVLILSRRPSLPPGELLQERGEAIRGNGSTDFCWVAWRRGRTEGAPRIVWAAP